MIERFDPVLTDAEQRHGHAQQYRQHQRERRVRLVAALLVLVLVVFTGSARRRTFRRAPASCGSSDPGRW